MSNKGDIKDAGFLERLDQLRKLINMPLHSTIVEGDGDTAASDIMITRVPGGWVYKKGEEKAGCYVPIPPSGTSI